MAERWLVVWKQEDYDDKGALVGPAWISGVDTNDERQFVREKLDRWMTKREAEELAARLGFEFALDAGLG